MDSNKCLPKEPTDSLSKVLRCQTIAKVRSLNEPSEVMAYLREGTLPYANILDYWKAKQYILSQLTSMVRDILVVLVADIGIEQMFNMARDICHYRCSNLKAESIQGSIMLKVFDKIELDSELNDIEDEENPFPIGEDESDEEEYNTIPDYISNYEEQEEPTNVGTRKKIYSIGHMMKTYLRDLYDDHYGDHINKQDENSRSEQE